MMSNKFVNFLASLVVAVLLLSANPVSARLVGNIVEVPATKDAAAADGVEEKEDAGPGRVVNPGRAIKKSVVEVDATPEGGKVTAPEATSAGGGKDLSGGASARIIGGNDASPTRYPYFAFIWIYQGTAFGPDFDYCGGTLIHSDIVATAAHCIDTARIIPNIEVWVNYTDDSVWTQYQYGRGAGFREDGRVDTIVHPGYDRFTLYNDIALIRLNEPVFNIPTPRINLDDSLPGPGQNLVEIGFGETTPGATQFINQPVRLQVVESDHIDHETCTAIYTEPGYVAEDLMFCKEVLTNPGSGACFGDSGSGLFVEGNAPENDMWVGIQSWQGGQICAAPGMPSGATRVSGYTEWLEREVCNLSDVPPEYCAGLPPAGPPTFSPITPPTPPPIPGSTPLPQPTPFPTRPPTPPPTPPPTKEPTKAPTPAPAITGGTDQPAAPVRPSFTPFPTKKPTEPPKELPTFPPTPAPPTLLPIGGNKITARPVGTDAELLNPRVQCQEVQTGGCSVCGVGLCVNFPQEIWSPPVGEFAPVACGLLEESGKQGLLDLFTCDVLSGLIGEACGCRATVDKGYVFGFPSAAPSDSSEPSAAPSSTLSPTISSVCAEGLFFIPGLGCLCFSGSSTVDVKNVGVVELRNVKIGDHVKVESDKYEPIFSFGHYLPDRTGDFMEIESVSGGKIQISATHMIELHGGTFAPANTVKVGSVLVQHGVESSVKAVRKVQSLGLYAPFTPSGKILVNGFSASSYVAFDTESPHMSIAGHDVSFQWLAHNFEFAHRVACHYLGTCSEEQYTVDGVSTWVATPLYLSKTVLDMENHFVKNALFGAAVAVLSVFSLVELVVFQYPLLLLLAVATLSLQRRNKKVQL